MRLLLPVMMGQLALARGLQMCERSLRYCHRLDSAAVEKLHVHAHVAARRRRVPAAHRLSHRLERLAPLLQEVCA